VIEEKRQMLVALQGVGATSAAILAREVFARSFASRRQLGSYLGLTPSAYDSGSMSKAGNSWARRILIEVAWLWQKYQPASPLSNWYVQRTSGQSSRIRRIMLIALARKLAMALRRDRPRSRGSSLRQSQSAMRLRLDSTRFSGLWIPR
jgi:transposase